MQAAAALAAARPTWRHGSTRATRGRSVGQADGYDMMVLRLTNSATTRQAEAVHHRATHAREYARELATRFAEHLVNGYGIDGRHLILDHHEIHLMLQANPTAARRPRQADRGARTPMRITAGPPAPTRCADLNRNFGALLELLPGLLRFPCDVTYRGPSAGSEPETQAIQDYLRATSSRSARGCTHVSSTARDDRNLHRPAQLRPAGHVAGASRAMRRNGRVADAGAQVRPVQRLCANSKYELYPPPMVRRPITYGQLGVASYVFEPGHRFLPGLQHLRQWLYPANLDALMYAAKIVQAPYRTPAGPTLDLVVTPGSAASGVGRPRPPRSTTPVTARPASPEHRGGGILHRHPVPWIAGATSHAAAWRRRLRQRDRGAVAAVNAEVWPRATPPLRAWPGCSGQLGCVQRRLPRRPAGRRVDELHRPGRRELQSSPEIVSRPARCRFQPPSPEHAAGPWMQLNPRPHPRIRTGFQPGTSTPADDTVLSGATYWYMLGDVALSGAYDDMSCSKDGGRAYHSEHDRVWRSSDGRVAGAGGPGRRARPVWPVSRWRK